MTAVNGFAVPVILAGVLAPGAVAPAPSPTSASSSAWRVVPSPSPPGSATLMSVSATAPGDAWAVGNILNGPQAAIAPLAEHWDGRSWRVVPVPDGPYRWGNRLNAVSAFSADDAWAVGASLGSPNKPVQPLAPLAEHWDGRSWTAVATPKAPAGTQLNVLTGVADLGPGDVWAVGSLSSQVAPYTRTLIEHFDGRAWHIVPSPNPGTEDDQLWQVAASGPDDVWATGRQSFSIAQTLTLAEHWDGQRWRAVPTPNDLTASFVLTGSLAVRSPADAWAGVSTSGNTNGQFFAHWDGKSWHKVTAFAGLQGGAMLNGLAIVSPAEVWFAGGHDGAVTGRWDGTRWQLVPTPESGKVVSLLEAITTVPGGHELIAVGYQATAGVQHQTLVLIRQV